MTSRQQRQAAKKFAAFWKNKGYEKGETQPFWLALLGNVFGVAEPEKFITFEQQVKEETTNFIDARIDATRVLIEQKSIGKDLRAPIKQSDGTMLSPFQQARRYVASLPVSQHPRWIVTCNFAEFLVYDMERPTGEPERVLLKNLEKEYYRLNFLTDTGDQNLRREMEISLAAGDLVGKLYDALLLQYANKNDAHSLKSLNALCVRLVFCLYAEDAGIFGKHNAFHDYLKSFDYEHVRGALIDLFKTLDVKPADRDPYMNEMLASFPYVNGGLFADENIEIPRFTKEIVDIILVDCSEEFDWSGISPTIFGAVFESTLNPETRRSGGMHYTSIENIHKVIDPLFLNALKSEFAAIKRLKTKKVAALQKFQQKIAALKFLDPACGSGNFLTETYLSLRRLENEVLKILYADGQMSLDKDFSPILVSISQFYGIEINDFAVTVSKTALWIAEAQMMLETENIVQRTLDFLPLKAYGHIVEGNALMLDWRYLIDNDVPHSQVIYAEQTTLHHVDTVNEPIVHYGKIDLYTKQIVTPNADEPKRFVPIVYDYIMGNPPFVGARLMSAEQKNALVSVFNAYWKNVGNMDFVSAWYKKCADIIGNSNTHCALVSTNSICQGEQAANLWKPLFAKGINIDFAYRTFRWDSEAKIKAHVHCIIVGFSCRNVKGEVSNTPIIYDESGAATPAKNINAYLVDADNVFVESRTTPICDVPKMDFGNMPNDAKGLLSNYTQEQKNILCKKYPKLESIFHRLIGSEEYINNKLRYCLWFKNADLSIIRKCPEVYDAVKKVREVRMNSRRAGTKKLADFPYLFGEIRQPDTNYIIIPRVSSERRSYIPIGFLPPEIIVNDSVQIISNATLYEFGVLTSGVHMAWMRAVCGRLKSDYRYSKDVVYNNFPWPNISDAQKAKIEATAQEILDARAKYPDSSLADLYDDVSMPTELRRAHQANDRAVMTAYGFSPKMTEAEMVAALMELYNKMSKK